MICGVNALKDVCNMELISVTKNNGTTGLKNRQMVKNFLFADIQLTPFQQENLSTCIHTTS
jgi:hypothetical protein